MFKLSDIICYDPCFDIETLGYSAHPWFDISVHSDGWFKNSQVWFVNNVPHSIDDLPAVICNETGTKVWMKHGVLHREGGPATISCNGARCAWYENGVLHRAEGLPAITWGSDRQYYVHGKLHRTDGPAVIMYEKEEWWENGELLRKIRKIPLNTYRLEDETVICGAEY
jgi:hypothetical protein